MKKYKEGSFVALSDFHSYKWPLEKITNYYLEEYDNIIILGDSTDRGPYGDGTYGIELLIKIMELSKKYPGRIHYVPGNHDSFLYNFMMTINNEEIDRENIEYNGGEETVSDVYNLYRNNPSKFNELMNWLGKQPLQMKLQYKDKKYCFAHAFFDNDLYNKNKDMNLNDYFNSDGKLYDRIFQILWFRKKKDSYDNKVLPDKDEIIVIGHTPEMLREGIDLDLVGEDGYKRKVICVDNGIAYGNGNVALKYDGNKPYSVSTNRFEHKNTSDCIYDSEGDSSDNTDNENDNENDYENGNKSFDNNKVIISKFDEIKYIIYDITGILFDKVSDFVEYLKTADYSILVDILYAIGNKIGDTFHSIMDKLNASPKFRKRLGRSTIIILIISLISFCISKIDINTKSSNNDVSTEISTEYDDSDNYITYIVDEGDMLSIICDRYGVSEEQIMEDNKEITNSNEIYVGQKIKIKQ